VYLRCLNELDASGVQSISSQALAEQYQLNAARFVRPGLLRRVWRSRRWLLRHGPAAAPASDPRLDRHLRVRSWGPAISAWRLPIIRLSSGGIRDRRALDAANEKIGHESRGGVPIYDVKELKRIVRRERLDIAVIAVPAPHAQPVVEQVIAAGIKAVLNFSPGTLKVPPDVKLKSVDLTVSLESLSFYLAQGDQ